MEVTFVVKSEEDKRDFAERLAQFFEKKTIRVKVEEVSDSVADQQHLLRRMEALRLITEQVPVMLSPDTDINDLIDDINDNPL
ncbi:hypothetical protein WBJ53_27085 [Spirosoma sp. SC4-14]|uniref:hypothetical protein n=1 Tax=Spirosoma sp. SC4-14 TaxID=3128900 RepID=UPI0030CB8737